MEMNGSPESPSKVGLPQGVGVGKMLNKSYRRSQTMTEQLVSGMRNRLLAHGVGSVAETTSVISKDIDKMIEAQQDLSQTSAKPSGT